MFGTINGSWPIIHSSWRVNVRQRGGESSYRYERSLFAGNGKSEKKKSFPANPNNLNQLVIKNEFATTDGANPVRFLLHDNGAGNAINSPIVIFSSDANLRHLASADRWFADGNFKLVPGIFPQLYVIRVTHT